MFFNITRVSLRRKGHRRKLKTVSKNIEITETNLSKCITSKSGIQSRALKCHQIDPVKTLAHPSIAPKDKQELQV